ncbi:MAG: hypothetical protein MI924_28950, partial [Chloroflexales bacterium]|nr:hypothetical protein [Chloroflexales bacterium]
EGGIAAGERGQVKEIARIETRQIVGFDDGGIGGGDQLRQGCAGRDGHELDAQVGMVVLEGGDQGLVAVVLGGRRGEGDDVAPTGTSAEPDPPGGGDVSPGKVQRSSSMRQRQRTNSSGRMDIGRTPWQ